MSNYSWSHDDPRRLDTLTVSEAAKELGVSPWAVKNACDRGEIKFFTLGNWRRIPRAEIERILEPIKDIPRSPSS